MRKTSSFFLSLEVFRLKMHWLWIYVFCSVVVRASLGVRSSLEKVQKIEHVLPSNEGFYNGTGEALTSRRLIGPILRNLTRVTMEITQIVKNPFISSMPTNYVCFDVLGCFSMDPPWRSVLRPIKEPMGPEMIKASVDFFSRENPDEPITIYLFPTIKLDAIPFDPYRTTVVIVHGFSSSGRANWLLEMKSAYLKVRDVNLFNLDWGQGAQRRNYLKVAGNTRVVGKELALLIKKLIKELGASAKDFHLIGHSLGSHICSYAAKEVPGIGRLTALDPAQPGFEGFSQEVRLDKSDAQFVEVLHTDARPFIPTVGFGMITRYGHVDYYLNGGFSQPGCLIPKPEITITNLASLGKYPVEMLFEIVSCPHTRAYKYYIEALSPSNCTFWGQKLHLMESLQITTNILTQGLLSLPHFSRCTPQTCIPMGLSSIKSNLRGAFIVMTSNSPPYCRV